MNTSHVLGRGSAHSHNHPIRDLFFTDPIYRWNRWQERVSNLLKVEQLLIITGYIISLAVYEKCPGVIQEVTSTYMLGIPGKASHVPLESRTRVLTRLCGHACVYLQERVSVTHSPTRTYD